MASTAKSFIALFGNVALQKQFCEQCQEVSLVIKGKLACCDVLALEKPTKYKRESEPEQRRRLPPFEYRTAQLEEQNHCCFYCRRPFGAFVTRKRRLVRLSIAWDHFIPYAYSQDNHARNFVAACQICNAIKNDRCFQTVEEACIYISTHETP